MQPLPPPYYFDWRTILRKCIHQKPDASYLRQLVKKSTESLTGPFDREYPMIVRNEKGRADNLRLDELEIEFSWHLRFREFYQCLQLLDKIERQSDNIKKAVEGGLPPDQIGAFDRYDILLEAGDMIKLFYNLKARGKILSIYKETVKVDNGIGTVRAIFCIKDDRDAG